MNNIRKFNLVQELLLIEQENDKPKRGSYAGATLAGAGAGAAIGSAFGAKGKLVSGKGAAIGAGIGAGLGALKVASHRRKLKHQMRKQNG